MAGAAVGGGGIAVGGGDGVATIVGVLVGTAVASTTGPAVGVGGALASPADILQASSRTPTHATATLR